MTATFESRKIRLILPLLMLLVPLAACTFAVGEAPPAVTPPPAAEATALPAAVISAADAEHLLLTDLYRRVSPSVVNIQALTSDAAGAVVSDRRGSGFVYDRRGHIITNAHLVLGADILRVTLLNAYVVPAALVGADSFSDLAVVKVEAAPERLEPLRIGSSAALQVGQRAVAIGNPFGLNSSLTAGVISGLGRALPSADMLESAVMAGFDNPAIIQIDVAMRPGNSGGPLLDSQGLAIGISTAIRSDSGGFQGVAFAVPADTMRRVIPELIAKGRVDYAWMGISVMREDGGYGVAGLSAALDLPVARGVLLRGVSEGSPAHRAGLRGGDAAVELRGEAVCAGGDVIIAINGYHFANLDALVTYLVQNAQPGDEVELLVIRDKQTLEFTLTLEQRPAEARRTLDCQERG